MQPTPAAALVLSLLCTSAAAQVPQLADLSYFTYGSGIGNGGFRISAVNGVTELLVPCGASGFAAGARYWLLHRFNPLTNNYDQVFASPVYPENDSVVRTAIGDVDPAAGPEIVVARRMGGIEVWNQASRTLLSSFSLAIGELKGLALGDADGDGDLDVVVCNASTLQARTAAGALLWNVPGATGNDLAIAQMDNDPALEVAVTSGRVVDCATRQVEFHWLNGFGIDLDAADIDGDGKAEVVFAEDWNWAWAFDIDLQLPKWSLPLGDIDCLTIANVDADATPEILIGEGQWGDVRVFDAVTQQQQFFINNSEHGVTSVAAGDVDGDGVQEIVFGAGWTSTGPDYFYVASAATQAIEWTSPAIAGGFIGPVRGDVDGDGQNELVVAASNLSYSSGNRVLVFDAATLTLEHVSATVGSSSYSSAPTDIDLADVNGDGNVEVFLTNGAVTCLDWNGSGFTQIWQVAPTSYSSPAFRETELADLDGNNTLEVVMGSTQYAHVYTYGATTELWRSFFLGGEVKEIAIGNSDFATGVEIHALSNDGNIYVFDGATRQPRAILQDGGVDRKSIHVIEGAPAMIAGDNAGNLFLFLHNGTTYGSIGPLPIAPGPVHAIGWLGPLSLLRVSTNERLSLQFALLPDWLTANYGAGFADKVSIDLSIGQVAAAGPFGLVVFNP